MVILSILIFGSVGVRLFTSIGCYLHIDTNHTSAWCPVIIGADPRGFEVKDENGV